MRPDVFAAWLIRLMPDHRAFVALSGDDWRLYVKHKTRATLHKVEMPGARNATIRELVGFMRKFRISRQTLDRKTDTT